MTPTSGDTSNKNNEQELPQVQVADETETVNDLLTANLFPNVKRSPVRVADNLPTFIVQPTDLLGVVQYLREEVQFTMFEDLTAIDWYPKNPRFEVVYHFLSLTANQGICLKMPVDGENPEVPSITGLFKGANWYEREVYDLFGIKFIGHPDLRRIEMPEDWEGHPLRKDYPVTGPRRANLPSNQYRPEGRNDQ